MARRKKITETPVAEEPETETPAPPVNKKFCQGMSAYYDDTPEIFPPEIMGGKYSKYFLEKKGLLEK